MGEISHRIFKIGGLTIVTVVTVLIFGISYATLCVIIPAASGTVYLSQKEYSQRRIRQAAAVHGRRMRNLGVLERQREWKHSSSSSDRTLHSSSAYNTPTNKLSAGFSQALPRMRRLNTTSRWVPWTSWLSLTRYYLSICQKSFPNSPLYGNRGNGYEVTTSPC